MLSELNCQQVEPVPSLIVFFSVYTVLICKFVVFIIHFIIKKKISRFIKYSFDLSKQSYSKQIDFFLFTSAVYHECDPVMCQVLTKHKK